MESVVRIGGGYNWLRIVLKDGNCYYMCGDFGSCYQRISSIVRRIVDKQAVTWEVDGTGLGSYPKGRLAISGIDILSYSTRESVNY